MLSGVKMVLVWYGMARFFQPEMNSGEENLNLNKRVRYSSYGVCAQVFRKSMATPIHALFVSSDIHYAM